MRERPQSNRVDNHFRGTTLSQFGLPRRSSESFIDNLIIQLNCKCDCFFQDFSYDPLSPQGPNYWHKLSHYCSGINQSPIDIRPEECEKSNHDPIEILGMAYAPKSVHIINDRYTVKFLFNWRKNRHPTIRGPELGAKNRFIPREVHFHWGHKSDRGSEHLIEGRQFALEMHIVSFNARYGSVANATRKPDGILAISQLFRATSFAKKYFFSDFIEQVKATGSQVEMTSHLCRFAFDEIIQIPASQWNYVTYSGSFTTPPCYENVKWLVFLQVQPMAEGQLFRLRQLQGLSGHIGDNFRPVQKWKSHRQCWINSENP